MKRKTLCYKEFLWVPPEGQTEEHFESNYMHSVTPYSQSVSKTTPFKARIIEFAN